jgi:hypothetical protein
MLAKKLRVDWDAYEEGTNREMGDVILYAMKKVAKAYGKTSDRKVSMKRFLTTYFKVVFQAKSVSDEFVQHFLDKLDDDQEQSLRLNIMYYLHGFPSRNAAPDVTVEMLLAFMVKHKITSNRELLTRSHMFESFSKDDRVVSRLRDVAEALIFDQPIPSKGKGKSPKVEGRMSRKELVAALDKCLKSKA